MRHPRAEKDHAEVNGVLYGSDEGADPIAFDEERLTLDAVVHKEGTLFDFGGSAPNPPGFSALMPSQVYCLSFGS